MSYKIQIHSLYICVKDMERSIRFYEEFLEQPVTVKDKVFSIFEIDDFRFCLFNNRAVTEDVSWGDNCLPSFEVNDIGKTIEKVQALGCPIVFPLKQIGKNLVFEFTDSEGNDIEVYASCVKSEP